MQLLLVTLIWQFSKFYKDQQINSMLFMRYKHGFTMLTQYSCYWQITAQQGISLLNVVAITCLIQLNLN